MGSDSHIRVMPLETLSVPTSLGRACHGASTQTVLAYSALAYRALAYRAFTAPSTFASESFASPNNSVVFGS